MSQIMNDDILVNNEGATVHLGRPSIFSGFNWTRLNFAEIYYCGRRMNQCRCGFCDGNCGPTNGCPCQSCYEFLLSHVPGLRDLPRNSIGSVMSLGNSSDPSSGGDTGLPSSQVYYCGNFKNSNSFGGNSFGTARCDPDEGDPCDSCFEYTFENIAKGSISGETEPFTFENACVVCMQAPKDGAVIHGNTCHLCCCYLCAVRLRRRGNVCPICRLKVERTVKVFWS
jgi:hypothetical protein